MRTDRWTVGSNHLSEAYFQAERNLVRRRGDNTEVKLPPEIGKKRTRRRLRPEGCSQRRGRTVGQTIGLCRLPFLHESRLRGDFRQPLLPRTVPSRAASKSVCCASCAANRRGSYYPLPFPGPDPAVSFRRPSRPG